MTATAPADRERLAQLMDDRRRELRLTWQQVSEAGGIPVKTLHAVRTGTRDVRDTTQAAIEAGLRWERGSFAAAAAGGDPVPLDSAPAPAVSSGRARPEPAPRREHPLPGDPDLAPYIQAVREDLGAAMAAYGPGFTGAQAFTTAHEAETWDDPDGLMPDPGDRVRLIARNRRRAGAWQSEERRIG